MNNEKKIEKKENINEIEEIKDNLEKEKNEIIIEKKSININQLWNNISRYK